MTFAPSNALQSFIPTTFIYPEDPHEVPLVLTDFVKKIITAVNAKDIGQYNTQEIVTGQQFFTSNNNNVFRQTYRKVIPFPTLAVGANVVAHGLGTLTNFTFTRIYGTAQNATIPLFVPLPQGGPNDAMIEVGAVNVTVTVPALYSGAGWSGLVVLEYIKAG